MKRSRRTIYRIIIVALVCLTIPGVSYANEPEDKVRMTRHEVDGARYDKFRGVVHVETSVEAVKALMTDSDRYADWLHRCRKVQILKGVIGEEQAYMYVVYAAPELPWYLAFVPDPKPRDMVLRVFWEEHATGKISVRLTNVNPRNEPALHGVIIPADTELVTVKTASVLFEIIPEENGGVTIIHEMYIDPNHEGKDLGIHNRYVKDLVEQTLKNIRDRLSKADG